MRAKVLVGCEYSGRVRDAFLTCGHDAVSCDLSESDRPGPDLHYQGDLKDIIYEHWDLLVVHPPCTYLSVSGLHWNGYYPDRAKLTEEALDFVSFLLNLKHIPYIALENPVGCINTRIREPEQIIHPWQFGHREEKTTCLWLKGLPPLEPTRIIRLKPGEQWDNRTASGQDSATPGPDRQADRSLTYQGYRRRDGPTVG